MEETKQTMGQVYKKRSDKPSGQAAPEVLQPAKARDPHIDVMKGIGILFVLIGHMQTLQYLGFSILAYLAMAMMPMFFFISGYLHSSTSEAHAGFGRYLLQKVRTLLVPYAVFFVLLFLWTQTVYAYANGMPLFGFQFNWLDLLLSFVFAGKYLYDFALVPAPLWFLHAMFFVSIVFYFVVKIKNKLILGVVAVALTLVALPLQHAIAGFPVWLVQMMPVTLFYMLFGYLFRAFVNLPAPMGGTRILNNKRDLLGGFVSLACLVAGLYCMRLGGGNMWEIASYWHFPGAVVSILGVYLFSRCTNNLVLQYVGVNSILYLGLHPMIVKLPFTEELPHWFEQLTIDGIMVYVCYFSVVFLLVSLLVLLGSLARGGWRKFLYRHRKKERA